MIRIFGCVQNISKNPIIVPGSFGFPKSEFITSFCSVHFSYQIILCVGVFSTHCKHKPRKG